MNTSTQVLIISILGLMYASLLVAAEGNNRGIETANHPRAAGSKGMVLLRGALVVVLLGAPRISSMTQPVNWGLL